MTFGKIERIAVCIFGELRSWRENHSSWSYLINNTDVQVDFFLHTWTTQMPPGIIASNLNPNELNLIKDIPITKDEMHDLISTVKPISYEFEHKKEFTPHNPTQPLYLTQHLSQWYALMKVGNLKSEYEIKNDFLYDLVLRFRYDIKLNDYIIDFNYKPKLKEVHGTHHTYHTEIGKTFVRFADLIWYSDSITFDILSNYYFEISNIRGFHRSMEPEYIWYTFCVKNFLDVYKSGIHWNFNLNRWKQLI